MLTVEVKLFDLDKKLGDLENRIRGDNDLWAAVASKAYGFVMNHFNTEVNEDGEAWEPWADWRGGFKRPSWTRPYGIGKNHRGLGAPYGTAMLRLTGNMRVSVARTNQLNYARIMCPVKYAVYHCQPNGPGSGKMPKRNFMYLNEEEQKNITDYMQKEIFKGVL